MFMQDATSFRPAAKIALPLPGLDLRPDGSAPGIVADSLVETDTGWRAAGALLPGTRVATWDGGFRPLVAVERRTLWPAAGIELIEVPGGALDTCAGFALLPGQHVFLASAIAETVLGAPGVLLPAAALAGHAGITRRLLLRPVEAVTLRFAGEEIVYVNSGALVHCPAGPGRARPASARPSGFFEVLDGDRARAMLALVADGALTSDRTGRAA